jgi:hypothetical protein
MSLRVATIAFSSFYGMLLLVMENYNKTEREEAK